MTKWRANPWAILVTISLGYFMTLLDLTIVNIAIPDMLDRLDASLDQVLWVGNVYILVLAVLLITAGRLGDRLGKKHLFISGVAVFALASLACGIAQSPGQLIAARGVQGLGAALLMPQTMSIVIETFPARQRGTALGVWAAVAGFATVAGPTVGGLLVTALDWRWIFFVNLPVGVLVIVMAVVILPPPARTVRHRFDMTGVLLATAALLCVVFALTEGQKYGWNGWIWALIGAGAVLAAGFFAHQRTRQDAEPLVPFSLLRDRNFAVLSSVGGAVQVAMIGLMLPLTVYQQSVLGFSALKAGLVTAPMMLAMFFVSPFAGRLSDRFGGKPILMAGLTLYAAGTVWIVAIAGVDTGWPAFVPAFLLAGIGGGGVFAPMATEAMRAVPPRLAGAASGVNNTVRQVGAVLGSAAAGAVLQSSLAGALADEAPRQAAALPPAYRDQFVSGFAEAGRQGLEVGAGQTGTSLALPPGTSPDIAARLHEAATQVFSHGFVDAMKPTLAVPIAAAVLGAIACILVRAYRAPDAGHPAQPAPDLSPAAREPS